MHLPCMMQGGRGLNLAETMEGRAVTPLEPEMAPQAAVRYILELVPHLVCCV